MKKPLFFLVVVLLGIFQLACALSGFTWFYTHARLSLARREGVFATPEEGMREKVKDSWINIEKVEIESAGPNDHQGRQLHVWFVTARVYAERRADGKAVSARGYDSAGSYFLRVKEGWVHVPEGAFPEFVGFGMELFGID